MPAVNTLAVVDRVVGKLKVILSGYSLTDWAGALRRATTTYNDRSHSYLMGSAPDDVKGSAELQYELDKVHGEQIKQIIKNGVPEPASSETLGAFGRRWLEIRGSEWTHLSLPGKSIKWLD